MHSCHFLSYSWSSSKVRSVTVIRRNPAQDLICFITCFVEQSTLCCSIYHHSRVDIETIVKCRNLNSIRDTMIRAPPCTAPMLRWLISSSWVKYIMTFFHLAFLVGGKYLLRILLARSFQELTDPASKVVTHSLAQSLKEKGNNLIHSASLEIPYTHSLPHICLCPVKLCTCTNLDLNSTVDQFIHMSIFSTNTS